MKHSDKNIGILTCPMCKHKQQMEIPTISCIPFYKCEGCDKPISAKKGCCVFCDYGDRPCPANHE